jgi:hypothetical protein
MRTFTAIRWTRSVATVVALAAALVSRPASAADPADPSVLDMIVKDLGLSFLAKPEETYVRLPLSPGAWTLFGARPYASVGPRVRTFMEEAAGLAAPSRDPADDLSKGVGVGAGLNWNLGDRLELFGEYQLFSLRGRSGTAGNPFGRREESPGLKGGFSIRF